MNVIPNRPGAVLRYFGGKWNLAPWIISHFPEHDMYLEPFFGAGSVLFSKPPCTIESINDLDGRAVNFFKVLRECPNDLIRYIKLSPWAKDEYILSLEASCEPLEDARRFYLMCGMSMAGSTATTEGSWRKRCYSNNRSPAIETLEIDHLYRVSDRLRLVQIENRDALEVIPMYDRPGCLIYADPPYVMSTRGGMYKFDVGDEFQVELARVLHECQGYVVLSGYPSEMYDSLYRDWERHDKEGVRVNCGEKRTECAWLSPGTVEALDKPRQQVLF